MQILQIFEKDMLRDIGSISQNVLKLTKRLK